MQVEDETYQLRPMNCPFHISVYKDGYYSYRDLPLRLAELGTVYRWVQSRGAGRCKDFHRNVPAGNGQCEAGCSEGRYIACIEAKSRGLNRDGMCGY